MKTMYKKEEYIVLQCCLALGDPGYAAIPCNFGTSDLAGLELSFVLPLLNAELLYEEVEVTATSTFNNLTLEIKNAPYRGEFYKQGAQCVYDNNYQSYTPIHFYDSVDSFIADLTEVDDGEYAGHTILLNN